MQSWDIKLYVAVILLKCYLVQPSMLDIHITLHICSQPVILDCGSGWVFYLVSLYAKGTRTICIQILFLFSPAWTNIFECVSWQFPAMFVATKKKKKEIFEGRSIFQPCLCQPKQVFKPQTRSFPNQVGFVLKPPNQNINCIVTRWNSIFNLKEHKSAT